MFDISFAGIGNEGGTTFLAGAGIDETSLNHVGKLSAAQTIDECDAEDVFYGVIDHVDLANEVLTLERNGFKEVPYTGSITPGWVELVGDGAGGVKEPASAGTGRMFHVVEVDSDNSLLMLDLG